MSTTITGSSIQVGSIDLTTPLAVSDGGTGTTRTYTLESMTVQSASGTSIDFTGIPSWAKRITVMFNGVSLSGTDDILVQARVSASPVTTGYVATSIRVSNANTTAGGSSTAGFIVSSGTLSYIFTGAVTLNLTGSNLWVASHAGSLATTIMVSGGGVIQLAGVLDGMTITRSGTNTFDAGSINVMYEG